MFASFGIGRQTEPMFKPREAFVAAAMSLSASGCGGDIHLTTKIVRGDTATAVDTAMMDSGVPPLDTSEETGTPIDTADTGDTVEPVTASTIPSIYVDVMLYPTVDLMDLHDQGFRDVTLAFVVAPTFTTCMATWGGISTIPLEDGPTTWEDGTERTLREGIDAFKAAGGNVRISLGGANGASLASACENSDDLYEQLKLLVDETGVMNLDFDIEGAWVADSGAVARRWEAVKKLQDEYPDLKVIVTLPVTPDGLDSYGVHIVEEAERQGVNLQMVNVMTMNYGAWYAPNPDDMGTYGIAAVESLHTQLAVIFPDLSSEELYAMIGTTPMFGANDVRPETLSLEEMVKIVDHARENDLGMVSGWSWHRDKPCPDGTPEGTVTYDCHGIDAEEGAFSELILSLYD